MEQHFQYMYQELWYEHNWTLFQPNLLNILLIISQ